jgi:hypothetical protein
MAQFVALNTTQTLHNLQSSQKFLYSTRWKLYMLIRMTPSHSLHFINAVSGKDCHLIFGLLKYSVKMSTGGPLYPRFQLYAVYRGPKKKLKNHKNKWFISFKTRAKREWAVTWWNPAAQTRPALDSSSFVPVPTLSRKLVTILLSSVLAVRISCHVIVVFVFRKQQEEWRSRWLPTII